MIRRAICGARCFPWRRRSWPRRRRCDGHSRARGVGSGSSSRSRARHALIAIRRSDLPSWEQGGRMSRSQQSEEAIMTHYVGLDVSDRDTAIHVVDEAAGWSDAASGPASRRRLPRPCAAMLRNSSGSGSRPDSWHPGSTIRLRSVAFRLSASMPVMRARRRPCSETKPMPTTPKHCWRSWSGPDGIGRHGSKDGLPMPCVVWSVAGRSSLAFRSTCRTRSAVRSRRLGSGQPEERGVSSRPRCVPYWRADWRLSTWSSRC